MDDSYNYESYSAGTTINLAPDVRDAANNTVTNRISGLNCHPRLYEVHQNHEVTQTPYAIGEAHTWGSHDNPQSVPTNLTYFSSSTGPYDHQPIQIDHTCAVAQTRNSNGNSQYVPTHLTDSTAFSESHHQQQIQGGYTHIEAHDSHYSSSRQFDTASPVYYDPSTGYYFYPQTQSTDALLASRNFDRHDGDQRIFHAYSSQASSSSIVLDENARCMLSYSTEISEYSKNESPVMDGTDASITDLESLMEETTPLYRTQARRTCVRCGVMRISCTGSEDLCTACNNHIYDCCVTLKQVSNQLISLDSFPDFGHNTTKCLKPPETAPIRHKANIFLQSGINTHNCYLECEVDVFRLQTSDPAYWRLKNFCLREDMQSLSTEIDFRWNQMLSCSLVPGSLQKEHGYKWILQSAPIKPCGATGALQSALFRCARSYIKDTMRPVHKLVELALIHTSLCSIWHSKSYMVLDDKFEENFRVCPRLRVEISKPLSWESYLELRTTLVDAVKDFQKHPDSHRLPLCLVLLTLLITHVQCDLLAKNKKASYFDEYAESQTSPTRTESPNSETKDQICKEEMEEQAHKEGLKNSFDMIKMLHKALFKREKKIAVPILDKELQISCGKCTGDTKAGECIHIKELRRELVLVRLALRAQQVDMQQVHSRIQRNRFCFDLEKIWGSDLVKADSESLATLDIAMASPHPNEDRLSEKVNFDGVSVNSSFSKFTSSCTNSVDPLEAEDIYEFKATVSGCSAAANFL